MNICFLTSFFLPDSVGGGETHTRQLAQGLRGRGHDIRIWRTASASAQSSPYVYDGLPVELAPTESRDAAESWLATRLAERPIDLVHVMISGRCEGMMAAVAAAGLPMVVTFLDFHYWCPAALRHADGSLCSGPESRSICHQCLLESAGRVKYIGPLWRTLPGPLQRAAGLLPRVDTLPSIWSTLGHRAEVFQGLVDARSLFIAPSPIMRRLAERAGVPAARIVDLPYGVPGEFVGAAREKSPSASFRIGYVGRLVAEKGVHVLLEAVSRLPKELSVELRLFGGAPLEAADYVRRLEGVAQHDPRIRFCGTIDQGRIADVHRDLDLIVIPSLWHENATIVLLESRALGTPVLVSDVEGMTPFVEPGRNGFTFPPGDAAALAARLAWCVEHRDVVREMSLHSRPLQTTDGHAAVIEATYQRLLRSGAQHEAGRFKT